MQNSEMRFEAFIGSITGQIKLLEIFHYIWGGIACLVGLIGIAYYIPLGPALLAGSATNGFFATFEKIWVGMNILLVILCEVSGALSLIAGGKYRKQRGYRFCFAVAVFNCLVFPVGTPLGAFAIAVLTRRSVQTLFQTGRS
jgi:hypothetical protein